MNTKPQQSLDHVLQFLRFTHQFRDIERVILLQDKDQWENDAEHSYQLALFAWYLIEHDQLKLDASKVIQLAMVHDLVEAYAGDTPIFGSEKLIKSKKEREAKAAAQLKHNFPDFVSLHTLIEEYEARQTKESSFVYALDKLIAVLNIYLDNGRAWHRENISLKQILESKKDIPEIAPDIGQYYQTLVRLLETNAHLFPDTA